MESGRAGLGLYTDPFSYSSKNIDKGGDHFDVYTSSTHSTLIFGVRSSDLVVYAGDGSGVLNRMDDLLRAASNIAGPGADLTYHRPDRVVWPGVRDRAIGARAVLPRARRPRAGGDLGEAIPTRRGRACHGVTR